MAYTNPTISDFKTFFNRDFAYGLTDDYVMDTDITKALTLARSNINTSLFADEEEYKLAYLLIAAHHLVTNLQASTEGVNGRFSWLITNNNVGNGASTVTYDIPDWIRKDKNFAYLTTTHYGAKYCSIVAPRCIANLQSFDRITRP